MNDKRIAIITINKQAAELAGSLPDNWDRLSSISGSSLRGLVKKAFVKYDGLVFIAAAGIVVRLIAGLAKDKLKDPAVVSVDSSGRFAISLLSGHEGGANKLAYFVAAAIGAEPVITTATQARKKFIIGLGSRKRVSARVVTAAILNILRKAGIKLEDARLVATAEFKKNEPGILKACAGLNLPLIFVPKEKLERFRSAGVSVSKVVKRHFGIGAVAEPCALLSGRRTRLIAKKEILCGVTAAIAGEN